MNSPVNIEDETKCAVRIVAKRRFDDGTEAGKAISSGFLWRHGGTVFLVTCWHCLSGKHPRTLEPLGSFLPNTLEASVRFQQKSETEGASVSVLISQDIQLESPDGEYLWLQHPHESQVDVAAVPIGITEDAGRRFLCLNDIDYTTSWTPRPTHDAFIVGFPEGFSGDRRTPIYKRASIASEPDLGFEGRPVILVDCIGNKALSGAPVIAKGYGIHNPLGGEKTTGDTIIGTWKNFMGVYSGRLGEDGIDTQIARVWKSQVIEEILGANESW